MPGELIHRSDFFSDLGLGNDALGCNRGGGRGERYRVVRDGSFRNIARNPNDDMHAPRFKIRDSPLVVAASSLPSSDDGEFCFALLGDGDAEALLDWERPDGAHLAKSSSESESAMVRMRS